MNRREQYDTLLDYGERFKTIFAFGADNTVWVAAYDDAGLYPVFRFFAENPLHAALTARNALAETENRKSHHATK